MANDGLQGDVAKILALTEKWTNSEMDSPHRPAGMTANDISRLNANVIKETADLIKGTENAEIALHDSFPAPQKQAETVTAFANAAEKNLTEALTKSIAKHLKQDGIAVEPAGGFVKEIAATIQRETRHQADIAANNGIDPWKLSPPPEIKSASSPPPVKKH